LAADPRSIAGLQNKIIFKSEIITTLAVDPQSIAGLQIKIIFKPETNSTSTHLSHQHTFLLFILCSIHAIPLSGFCAGFLHWYSEKLASVHSTLLAAAVHGQSRHNHADRLP
jgi:hypothetical protein